MALAAHRNAAKLARQILAWQPAYAALADAAAVPELKALLGAGAPRTRVLCGAGALEELAALAEVQCVMAAIVGAAGLRSTLAAARAGKRLLLANKESLVMAGPLLLQAVRSARRDAAADRQRAQRDLPVPAAAVRAGESRRRACGACC